MFYVKSSLGVTDVLALILKKYTDLNIGRALLITDILIVLAGVFSVRIQIIVCSFIGLLIKTRGIDFVISKLKNIGGK